MSKKTEQAKGIFAIIDKNGDGIASLEEITAALARACVADPAAEAAVILEGKPGITFEDFNGMDKAKPFYSLALFAYTDANNDGKISKEELQVSVTSLDGPEDITPLFNAIDIDKDGFITYAELKSFFAQM